MAYWRGQWQFNNVMHRFDGKTGTVDRVEAKDEKSAEEKIKTEASYSVFGTSMMWEYFRVSRVEPLR